MDKLWRVVSNLMPNNPSYEAPIINKLAEMTLDLLLGLL
jgi:hypothetical protein